MGYRSLGAGPVPDGVPGLHYIASLAEMISISSLVITA